jgi:hypothetical protein
VILQGPLEKDAALTKTMKDQARTVIHERRAKVEKDAKKAQEARAAMADMSPC